MSPRFYSFQEKPCFDWICMYRTKSGADAQKALSLYQLTHFYCSSTKKIRILNSSSKSSEYVLKILYSEDFAYNYQRYYPLVDERDSKGNWFLKFINTKPTLPIFMQQAGVLSKVLGIEVPDNLKLAKKILPPLSFNEQEIQAFQNQISETIKNIITEATQKKNSINGIWYPQDLAQYINDHPHELENLLKTAPGLDLNACRGYLNQEYFTKVDKWEFKLNHGKSASVAIRSIFEGVSILDCGSFIVACYYKAILEMIGESKFDAFFNTVLNDQTNLYIGQQLRDVDNLMSCFCRLVKETKHGNEGEYGNRPHLMGDKCGFNGVRYYLNKHPGGFAQGWNVICVGKNLNNKPIYLGQGFEKPLTEEEIIDLLFFEFNKERNETELKIIEERNEPSLYNPFKNPWLSEFYTITKEDIEKYTSFYFLDGFIPCSSQRLEAKLLLVVLKADNVSLVKEDLLKRRLLSSLVIHDGSQRIIFNMGV